MAKRKRKLNKDDFDDERLKAYIEDEFPEIGEVLLPNGFSSSFIGICLTEERPRLVFDANKIIETLMKRDEMDYEEAIEFFEYNIAGFKTSEMNHPLYIHLVPDRWNK